MTTITKIGNSRGVRIPKAIIKQANLENTELNLRLAGKFIINTYQQRTQNPK